VCSGVSKVVKCGVWEVSGRNGWLSVAVMVHVWLPMECKVGVDVVGSVMGSNRWWRCTFC